MRILGHDIRRVDGPAKVTGRAKYAYDVNLPGMLHARVLRSPVRRGADRLAVGRGYQRAQRDPRREGGPEPG